MDIQPGDIELDVLNERGERVANQPAAIQPAGHAVRPAVRLAVRPDVVGFFWRGMDILCYILSDILNFLDFLLRLLFFLALFGSFVVLAFGLLGSSPYMAYENVLFLWSFWSGVFWSVFAPDTD